MRDASRSAAVAVLLVPARSAVHPKVSRSQAVKRLGAMLGAKPEHLRPVWADERTTDVVLLDAGK